MGNGYGFRSRDKEAMKAAQQEVKHCVREAKDSYRRKVEQKLKENIRRIRTESSKNAVIGTALPPGNCFILHSHISRVP